MHALITGSNRGIGAALSTTLVNDGWEVTGTARIAQVSSTRASDAGSNAVLEVTDPASHAALARSLEGRPIDLLVCNAGVYLDKETDLETGYEAALWAQTFAVNVTGVFLTVQSLLPNLDAAKAPRIAIISSTMASDTRAPGGSYIYRSSKAAVLNLGRNLATDLKPRGIAVGIYHPGWVITDMGGAAADIDVDSAAAGLVAEFGALDLSNTGRFRTWDGRDHDF